MHRINLKKIKGDDVKAIVESTPTTCVVENVEKQNSLEQVSDLDLASSSDTIVDLANSGDTRRDSTRDSTTTGGIKRVLDFGWLEMEDISVTTRNSSQPRIFKLESFIVSYKFIIATYSVLLIVHIALWAIVGGVNESLMNSTGEYQLTYKIGFFNFTQGCVTQDKFVFFVAAEVAVYIVVELVFVILSFFFADRDTWFIKKESVFLIFSQVFFGVIYVVLSQIPIYSTLVDYIFPYGLFLVLYSYLEVVVSVLLPIFYAIHSDLKLKRREDCDLEILLKNKTTYLTILDFGKY